MNGCELKCLQEKKEVIIQDLRPKYIISSLKDILHPQEQNEILGQPENSKQTEKLLEVLCKKKMPGIFEHFLNALKKDDSYPWIANELKDYMCNNSQDDYITKISTKLHSGGVPFPVENYITRKEHLETIRNHIKSMLKQRSQRGWVVLHGMQGSGKSVLASEVFRDEYFHISNHVGHVWWVKIGAVNKRQDGDLLLKMHNLCDKLGLHKPTLPTSVEMATDRLKRVMSKPEYRDSIIILDDVKDCFVIEAFDVGCLILVTTKNKSIMNSVSGTKCFVSVDGLTKAEAKEYLAMFVNTKICFLPKEVEGIIEKCKASPLALSMIGALVSIHANKNEKWKYYLNQLNIGHLSRIRRLSGDSSLTHAIHLSIEDLNQDKKKYYYDFALFQEDVYIPNKVLEVLWDKDETEVEEIMYDFVTKSLARREEQHSRSYKYGIHDLNLYFLKENCKNIEELHSKLVSKYLKLCKTDCETEEFDYTLLPDDGYIYYYLAFHIFKSGQHHLFSDILLDLKLIQKKMWITGVSDLLYEYDVYSSYFAQAEAKKDMECFIRRTDSLLCEDKIDIVQLALCQPVSSTVYRKGRDIADKSDKIYLEWCNLLNVHSCDMLRKKVHIGSVNTVMFSQDDKIVASSGEDNVVRLWESTSGKLKQVLRGHHDAIKCCVFSHDGNSLLTASLDRTVKLWTFNLEQQALYGGNERRASIHGTLFPVPNGTADADCNDVLFTFTEHEAEVSWCAFSHDDILIVSSDCKGKALVWQNETGEVKWILDHDEGINVTCCSFSQDDSIIATSSMDIIKIWNSAMGECMNSLKHSNCCVMSFCFTNNNKYLMSAAGSFVWQWDVNTLKLIKHYNDVKESYSVSCCNPSSDNKYIAAGTTKKSIIVWDIVTKQKLINLKCHGVVQCIAYSNDGSRLLSCADDGTVMIWDLKKRISMSMVDLTKYISVQFIDEKPIIAITDEQNCLQILTGLDGSVKAKFKEEDDEISSCCLSPDYSKVGYGLRNGFVKVIIIDPKRIKSYKGHECEVNFSVYSTDSTFFVTCSADCTLMAWHDDGTFFTYKGHEKQVTMCKLYQNNERILSCSEDGTIKVWEISNETSCLITCPHGSDRVTYCDVSCNEEFFASSSVDCTVKLWNSKNGELLNVFNSDSGFRCCRLSPSNNFLAAGNDDGIVKVWCITQMRNNHISKELKGHNTWVNDLAFSPDESKIVAVSDCIKWWLPDGTELQTFKFCANKICSIFPSPDFSVFVAVDGGTLYILKTIS